jgi:general secretion pathway protein H
MWRTGDPTEGFTLLELIVVMALLALVSAMIVPRPLAGIGGSQLRSAARQVGAGLRQTRGLAIARNQDAAFTMDVRSGLFRAGGGDRGRRLPQGIEARLITATSEQIDPSSGAIRFFPNGSSTGGRVLLSGAGRHATVAVDWLTGRVAIDD